MKAAKAKGRLRRKQPKLKPNQAKHLAHLQGELGPAAGRGRAPTTRSHVHFSAFHPACHCFDLPITDAGPNGTLVPSPHADLQPDLDGSSRFGRARCPLLVCWT
jgi:hypothetical protein